MVYKLNVAAWLVRFVNNSRFAKLTNTHQSIRFKSLSIPDTNTRNRQNQMTSGCCWSELISNGSRKKNPVQTLIFMTTWVHFWSL